MPIQLGKINSLNLFAIKKAIEKLGRNSLNLQNPSSGDNLYLSSMPSTADLDEGQAVFVNDGGTWKFVVKINNSIKSTNLT